MQQKMRNMLQKMKNAAKDESAAKNAAKDENAAMDEKCSKSINDEKCSTRIKLLAMIKDE